MVTFPYIPSGSVLGLNYSGMHDSAVAIVGPDGTPIFACALERLTRVKQDGRPPFVLLEKLPWDRIVKVAISTNQSFVFPSNSESKLLRVRLPSVRNEGLRHEPAFYDFLESIPVEKEFVCHQMAHAASAFWASGFETALCLTYDGGMSNSPWFGGLYLADRRHGLRALDQFSALHYAKVTSLYTFVTALLGFTPNKHEGKITGLAACGVPSDACRTLLHDWFENDPFGIESTMEWVFTHHMDTAPMLLTNDARIQPYRLQAGAFSKEELAATVQEIAESHVLNLLGQARALGWHNENMCLAGGLLANVKINQRIVESGFSKLFVAPPMTDDGTALGAAWHVLSNQQDFSPPKFQSMYLGPSYAATEIETLLKKKGIHFTRLEDPARSVAAMLAKGHVVAVFQGAMEFGPRSLGNRSILAQATESDINQSLNKRLNRTEFMPFAPVSRVEDAQKCYLNIEKVLQAAEFMTVTLNCTDEMKALCPAVVHTDGTARPQLVSQQNNPFIHAVLTSYLAETGSPALVNTSFNIHEEPIVCSPQDAIQGFFESGLDYLCFEGVYLVSFKENSDIALRYLQDKTREPGQKVKALAAVAKIQNLKLEDFELQLAAKEAMIQQLKTKALNSKNDKILIKNKEAVIQQQKFVIQEKEAVIQEKEAVIKALSISLSAFRMAFSAISLLQPVRRMFRRIYEIVRFRRIYEIVRPRLGILNQYAPRPICEKSANTKNLLGYYPVISITTPSFAQGEFIERTLVSVFNQNYPNLEFFVQDGGSKDSTVEVLKKHQTRLSGWVSEKDTGQSQAINLGLKKTSGEIMGWLNSDDLLLPGALYRVADYFNLHPDVDVVYGNRLLINENDMEIGRWILPGHDNAVLSWVDYIPQETMFWRRRIWDKVGGQIDESFKFAMDWELLLRFRDADAKFGHIPQFLGAFRIHEHQKTSASINKIGLKEMNRLRERVFGRVPEYKEIRRNVLPYLIKHIAVDMIYRVRQRLRKKI